MLFSCMAAIFAIGGYSLMARRSVHTRMQLLAAAVIGGGIGGALFALAAALGGGTFGDVSPYALFGLVEGAQIGLLALLALTFGRWLDREP